VNSKMRRGTAGLIAAAAFVLGTSTTALAGETNGRGEPIPGAHKASSVCAFSGQDLPDEIENNPPGFDDDEVTGGHVQTYGQYVRAGLKGVVPSPGQECRGNLGG
jgi:hypothetical protein